MSASPASSSLSSDISQIRIDSLDSQSGGSGRPGGAGGSSGVGSNGAGSGGGGVSNGGSGGQQVDDERRRSEQLRKLFVGGLAPFVSDDQLKEFFADFGDITDVVVMKDNKTGRSRGFGFVTYREPEMVDAAQAARPHVLGGKQVETKRAMPREDSDKPEAHMTVKKLFVGALKKDVTSEDLRDYFAQFGNVEEAEVMTWKETGESRGFGFVTFDDYDPVDKCILYKPHSIRSSRADVKKALSKEEMSKVKAKQEQQKFTGSPFSPTAAAIKLAAAAQSAAAEAAAAEAADAAYMNARQRPPPPPPLYYQAYHPHQHGGGAFAALPACQAAYHMQHAANMPHMFAPGAAAAAFGPSANDCFSPYALHAAAAAGAAAARANGSGGGMGGNGGNSGGIGYNMGGQLPTGTAGFHFPAIFHAEGPPPPPVPDFVGAPRWNEVCQ